MRTQDLLSLALEELGQCSCAFPFQSHTELNNEVSTTTKIGLSTHFVDCNVLCLLPFSTLPVLSNSVSPHGALGLRSKAITWCEVLYCFGGVFRHSLPNPLK